MWPLQRPYNTMTYQLLTRKCMEEGNIYMDPPILVTTVEHVELSVVSDQQRRVRDATVCATPTLPRFGCREQWLLEPGPRAFRRGGERSTNRLSLIELRAG